MSEIEKRNLFGRLFGGNKTPPPAPAAEEKPASDIPAVLAPEPSRRSMSRH